MGIWRIADTVVGLILLTIGIILLVMWLGGGFDE